MCQPGWEFEGQGFLPSKRQAGTQHSKHLSHCHRDLMEANKMPDKLGGGGTGSTHVQMKRWLSSGEIIVCVCVLSPSGVPDSLRPHGR